SLQGSSWRLPGYRRCRLATEDRLCPKRGTSEYRLPVRAEAPRVAVAHRADRLSCRKAISSRLRLRFTVAVSARRACRFAPGLVGFRSSYNIDRLRLGELRNRDSTGLEDR